jgi:predicted metalloenzyme YecM
MSAAQTAQIIRLAIDALYVAQMAGIEFQQLGALLSRARAEGRDITDAEIEQLAAGANQALTELDSAIAARKNSGQ